MPRNKIIEDRRAQFTKIDTGNGFQNNLMATTNDRLELTVIELQNLQVNNTEQTKKLTKAISTLEGTIKELDLKNSRQQNFNTLVGVIATLFTILSVIQVIDIIIRGIGK